MRVVLDLTEQCIRELQLATDIDILAIDDETGELEADEDNLTYAIEVFVSNTVG